MIIFIFIFYILFPHFILEYLDNLTTKHAFLQMQKQKPVQEIKVFIVFTIS